MAAPAAYAGPANVPKTIDHIGIIVSDLEAAMACYEPLLGTVAKVTELPAAGVRVASFKAANIEIELIAYLSDEPSLGRATMGAQSGLNHLSIRVPDMAAAIDELAAAGWVLQQGFPTRGAGGTVAFFERDPASGLLLEICQPQQKGDA